MIWVQGRITLAPRPRGFHMITHDIFEGIDGIEQIRVGMLHLLIQHTSASLTLNENVSADVRHDFETWFNQTVPEQPSLWTHRSEGADDMPAHIKASVLGAALSLPLKDGRPALGTWQGIYLCEHRDHGGPRSIVATAFGEG